MISSPKSSKRPWPSTKPEQFSRQLELIHRLQRLRATERLAPVRRYADDPLGLIERIIGPDEWRHQSWMPWKVFLKGFFAVDPDRWTTEERRIYSDCTGRQDFPEKRAAEAWAICGRRAGKSRVFSAIATYLATAIDWRPYLAPGERGYIPVIAPDRRQARAMMGYIAAPFMSDPLFKAFLVKEPNTEQIELVDGVTIEVMTCNYGSIRSRTVLAALCDECAFWPKGDSASPDTEVITALKPCMATIPNAPLLGASSPYDRRGVLWDQYSNNFGRVGSSSLVWQAATTVMNSTISAEWVDEQLALDYEKNSAEYLATFRRDITAFVTKEVVDAAVQPGRFELPPQRGVSYTAFCDPSGGSADSMTLAIGHMGEGGRGVLDMIREVIPPFDPESVVTDFSADLRRYGLGSVEGDHYAGSWVGSRFQDCGIVYEVAEKTKSQIYGEFLPLLNAQQIEYLDHRRLINQTLGLERRTARGGRDTIDHSIAPGSHDDIVNASAGVLIKVAHGASGAEQLRRFLGG